MNRIMAFGAAVVAGLVVVAVARGHRDGGPGGDLGYRVVKAIHVAADRGEVSPGDAPGAAASPEASTPSHEVRAGLLYGRVTLESGEVYEGRLRWGGDEEALWSNYFNGFRARNPWAGYAPADALPREGFAFEVFGRRIGIGERASGLGRPFMVRFGDIARIEPRGRDLLVTLKSGTVAQLDRYAADDVADGVRVWDADRGVVDIGEWGIRSIELLGGAAPAGPSPLHGTVRTTQGEFTGLIQWDREACLGTDLLDAYLAGGESGVRFDAVRSIARRSSEGAVATLLDGREIVLPGTRANGQAHRGIYVDDARYGRVLVSWDAFERVDFGSGGSGPAYAAFEPGRPLTGSVLTHSGRHFEGRLVYDLDESETNETLDAPSLGIDYTIPFGLIASVALPAPGAPARERVTVTLRSGEVLLLEAAGDLGGGNAGLLVFADGSERAEYVPWSDVRRVSFGGAGG